MHFKMLNKLTEDAVLSAPRIMVASCFWRHRTAEIS